MITYLRSNRRPGVFHADPPKSVTRQLWSFFVNKQTWWLRNIFDASHAPAILLLSGALFVTGCADNDDPNTADERCNDVVCQDNASCDAQSGLCGCDEGFESDADQCVEIAPPATGCSADADCNDGLACNGIETCDLTSATCQVGEAIVCGDNALCDEAHGGCACDSTSVEVDGQCQPIACQSNADCDDGNACNGIETCDLEANQCVTTEPVVCEEFNEICDASTGDCVCPAGYEVRDGLCEHIRCTQDADCDNGIICDGQEVCDLELNRCLPGESVQCANNQDCSEMDGSCACKPGYKINEDTGFCVAFCTEDSHCGEPSVCGVTQVCNLDNNRCVNGTEVCGARSVCDPLAPEEDRCACAVGSLFDEETGTCMVVSSCESDADCDDGIFCNGAEVCGSNGRCVTSSPAFVGSVLCPLNGYCSEADDACLCKDGFVHIDGTCVEEVCRTDSDCDDGLYCNGVESCDVENNQCVSGEPAGCGLDERCHEGNQACTCAPGFEDLGGECVAITCESDGDCASSGGLCDGELRCNAGTCEATQPVDCGNGFCIEEEGETWCQCAKDEVLIDGQCALACPVPQAPVMNLIQQDIVLNFEAPVGYAIEIAELGATEDVANAVWSSAASVDLAQANHNPLRIIARTSGQGCQVTHDFDWTYELVEEYPSIPQISGQRNLLSNAIPGYLPSPTGQVTTSRPLNPLFKQWPTGFEDMHFGTQVDSSWRKPEKVFGPPRGTFGVIVLGNDGRITLTFDQPITDGPGADFAVFENGFVTGPAAEQAVAAELAYVEVSSDGQTFLRFDTHALQDATPGPYGRMSPRVFNNLAGTQPAFFGNPFDLHELRNRPEVIAGKVDLERITHVRIIDIVGDRDNYDSFGNVIHDNTPTWGSGGFDLDTVGVIHVYEETP